MTELKPVAVYHLGRWVDYFRSLVAKSGSDEIKPQVCGSISF